jgi:hypothetical protein
MADIVNLAANDEPTEQVELQFGAANLSTLNAPVSL